jgi:hypothetical protein
MGLICALFYDVTQPRLVITVVSGQPVSPIFKGRGVQESPKNGIYFYSSYIFLSTPGLLNLLCGAGNFGKILSTCGQREIQNTV